MTNEQLSRAEEARLLKEATTPRQGWTTEAGSGRWQTPGVTYVVLVHGSPTKKRWIASDPPFVVVCPDGVKMGGSSHLARAQRLAEILGVPLPPRVQKVLDDDAEG